LKQHLLPRILSDLRERRKTKASLFDNLEPGLADDFDESVCKPDSVVFKNDRLYRHNTIRINYTTYDVRRAQDTINPKTSHCNVMVLKDDDMHSEDPEDWFRYAQVLAIYHANVIYVGPGMLDYEPRRVEFLWVRFYQKDARVRSGWQAQMLDRIQFPSIFNNSSFGFISPDEVLRASHIMPAFSLGRLHLDGRGLSKAVKDSAEWKSYFVGRFVHAPHFP
jgi:hypothetical protein